MDEIDSTLLKDCGKLFKERIAAKKKTITPQNIVSKNLKHIDSARSAGLSWEEIAATLNEALKSRETGKDNFSLTGAIVRFHYRKITNSDRNRQKEPRRTAGRRSQAEESSQPVESESEFLSQASHSDSPVDVASLPVADANGTTTPPEGTRSRFNFNTVRPQN